MRQTARISGWCGERGFGFASSGEGKHYRKFFVHLSEWKGVGAPQVGQLVSFEEGIVLKGPSPPALDVRPE